MPEGMTDETRRGEVRGRLHVRRPFDVGSAVNDGRETETERERDGSGATK